MNSRPNATWLGRTAVVALTMVLSAVAVILATGLLTSQPSGVADNGDGARLFCGQALLPVVPKGDAAWAGGVVSEFLVDSKACPDPIPSSAGFMLGAAMHTPSGQVWNLTQLAWLYVGAVALVTGLAAWAVTARSRWRVLWLLPGLLPLAQPDFARFFLSTYGEPAGLLGTFAMVSGTAVILATQRSDRAARIVGLVLVAGGGLFTAAAKIAYFPVLAMAFVVCVATAVQLREAGPSWTKRLIGPLLAGSLIVGAAAVIPAGLQWQERNYPGANVHNLIFTTVLPEVPGAAQELGLPAAAAMYAGSPIQTAAADVPGRRQIEADPATYRTRALAAMQEHPAAALRSVTMGLQATLGRDLPYLTSEPYAPGAEFLRAPRDAESRLLRSGEQSATSPALHHWLDQMPAPWLPSAVLIVGLLAGAAGLWWRRTLIGRVAIGAGVAAATSLGLVVAALADGYFELAKHVWLASYLLDVTAWTLVAATVLIPYTLVRRRLDRRARHSTITLTDAAREAASAGFTTVVVLDEQALDQIHAEGRPTRR